MLEWACPLSGPLKRHYFEVLMKHKVGDIIKIKVENQGARYVRLITTERSQPYDENACTFEKVQIVGVYQAEEDYIALYDKDPHGYFSFKLEAYHQKGYDVADKFIGERGTYIEPAHIWSDHVSAPTQQLVLHSPGGMTCKLCEKFIQYAGVNRDDGGFVCHKCVSTKGWKLTCQPLKK
jgi:hypothetical protein